VDAEVTSKRSNDSHSVPPSQPFGPKRALKLWVLLHEAAQELDIAALLDELPALPLIESMSG
jgi:hypothetical protein